MDEKKTYLKVPPDATAHAYRFGARRDLASGLWFVIGPVPGELLNYLPRPRNERFHESTPSCPWCGASMRKLVNRQHDAFWSCTRFKLGCQGKIDYLDYLDQTVRPIPVGDYISPLIDSIQAAQPLNPRPSVAPTSLKKRWTEIVYEAHKVLGGEKEALRWLSHQKLAFGNKTPIQMLGTKTGCDAVMQALHDVWK